jgi:hypothetical protein
VGIPSEGAPRLDVVERDRVVEPIRQKHRESGAFTVTRWVGPDKEPRYAWVRTPEEPKSDDEAVDRLFALYEVDVRRLAWEAGRYGGLSRFFLSISGTEFLGDSARLLKREGLEAVTVRHPAIRRAIEANEDPRRVPVYIYMGRFAGLRWLELRADDGARERRDEVVERPAGADLQLAPPPAEDAEEREPEAPSPTPPRRKRTDVEVWDAIMQGMIDDEMDRLVGLTDDELDREIAKVGFDAARERAKGPGLRQRVVRAIARRRLEDDPPPGV